MNFVTEILSESDLQEVDDLSRRYKNTLGFLTAETFRDYLRKGGVLGARTETGQLAGYLLFAKYSDRFWIAQLCVSEEFRQRGIARLLVDELKASATTQRVIKLRCRRDFAAHTMWEKFGFIPLNEKPGRSSQGHLLTLWCYRLRQDDELGLWKAEASDEVLDIVIDAQILFDFDAPENLSSIISKGLLNDFLVDSLNLWITDELFLEINRQDADDRRQRSMQRARGMAQVVHQKEQAQRFAELLKTVLPYQSASEKSDLHHLSKTAASDLKVFCTKDDKLLTKAHEIESLIGVAVLHPVKIITSLHEITARHSYSPTRISGLNLHWRRMRGEDCDRLSAQFFQKTCESKGRLLEIIRSFLSQPQKYRCETLQVNSREEAIRVLEGTSEGVLIVHLARLSISTDAKVAGDFLVADTLSHCVEHNMELVLFSKHGSSERLEFSLSSMGFKSHQDMWIKAVIARSCSRGEAQKIIADSMPETLHHFQGLSELDFERDCAPLLSNPAISTYLIPIRPTFAMGLLDRKQAADDLFGGDPSILLRWDNVYYRKNSHHKMLQAPGRILWYVSRSVGAIIAVSHLDEIDIGLPKDLFRKYRRFGILEWRDIYNMCEKNIEQPLMALRFSRTFLFRMQIPLTALRAVLAKDGISESLQAPSIIPFQTAKNLYEIGFSQPS